MWIQREISGSFRSINTETTPDKDLPLFCFFVIELLELNEGVLQLCIGVLYLCHADGKMEALLSHHSPGWIHFEADVVWGDDDSSQQRLQ